MPRVSRLLVFAVLLLAASTAAAQLFGPKTTTPEVLTTPASPPKPALPTIRFGAILPLSGPAGWFGKEMRQGMELAMADLNRPAELEREREQAEARKAAEEKAREARKAREGQKATDEKAAEPKPEEQNLAEPKATEPKPAEPKAPAAAQPAAPALPPLGVTLALETADVAPLDLRRARDEFTRLAALPVHALFTATAGPTLALQQLAAGRDILLVHQGIVTDRFGAGGRLLLHTRPSVGAQVEALLAQFAARPPRRLAVVVGGDDFGKTVRAVAGARWRTQGRQVVEESLNLEGPDLAARIRDIVRGAPDAIVLGFRGPELGDVAVRLREARYAGPLFLLDDDRAARLAGGVALEGAVVVTDAFVPELGSAGERFAEEYKKKFGAAPSRYAAHAYDAVMMLAEGLRNAKGIPGGTRLRETVAKLPALPSVYGGTTTLREDGTLAGPLGLFTIDQGELAFVRHLGARAGRS
jgi:ABC-type branched-subunit amino acid transport system substrate-binding protein